MIRTRRKRNGGRKSKYNDGIPERAYRLCLLGVTNNELAIALDVSVQTVEKWLRERPEFKEAVQRGRLEADSKVARALYKRAVGFKVKSEIVKTVNGEVVKVPVTKYYPPDVNAIEIWLKNRQRHIWSFAARHEVSGPNGKPIQINRIENIPMDDIDDSILDFLVEQALNRVNKEDGNN